MGEYCDVVERNCKNPPGMDRPRTRAWCDHCGVVCCKSCRVKIETSRFICVYCYDKEQAKQREFDIRNEMRL